MHEFDSYREAWNAANALLENAYKNGAIEVDINNEFYSIIEE